jgi:hypothetical protein
MSSGVWRCAFGASLRGVHRHGLRLLAISLFGLTATGCNINGEPIGPLAAGRSASIAIESIDGPPPALTRRFAKTLGEEAEARQFVVVPREDSAQYFVRGYLTTHVERDKTSIAWVWDVYGADKRRAFRISGEEPSGSNARDAWAAVDDGVLRRIARSGMDRILVYLNSSEREPLIPASVMVPLTTNAEIQPPPY